MTGVMAQDEKMEGMSGYSKNFDFGVAIRMMKNGAKVCREGWNGKGQHVYVTKDTFIQHDSDPFYGVEPCFILFNAQGKWQPGWVPSTSDVLAEDWQIAE